MPYLSESELPLVNLKVEIQRTSDLAMSAEVWPNWRLHLFYWEEGNASCDCNRELFFLRARGEEEPEEEGQCGGGRFLIRLSDADTGEVFFDEIADHPDSHPAL